MKKPIYTLLWTIIVPLIALVTCFIDFYSVNVLPIIFIPLLIGCVLSAVHHAEVVAYKVGEPLGSFILAFSITIIEVGIIVSLMINGNSWETNTLVRDTVVAANMIILTGIIGLCILVGAIKYKEQTFTLQGVSTALITLTTILALTLILPNYTTSLLKPEYNNIQLILIAIVCFVLYVTFILIQSIRHRAYFMSPSSDSTNLEFLEKPNRKVTIISAIFLIICLGIVVLIAKSLSHEIESAVIYMHAPKELVGVIIAAIVLLPESYAAYRAALKNQLQTSLNIGLGSALASIGLTIPVVAVVSLITGIPITLGIDTKAMVLLLLAQFILILSLATGRTNILQGIVLLMIFLVYILTSIIP